MRMYNLLLAWMTLLIMCGAITLCVFFPILMAGADPKWGKWHYLEYLIFAPCCIVIAVNGYAQMQDYLNIALNRKEK